MKKCPSCQKTYEDSMRFCQTDGTALVDDAPPVDPYKTVVARSEDIPVSVPVEPVVETQPAVPVKTPFTAPAGEDLTPAIQEPGEVLDLPGASDPLKTMYISDAEMRQALSGDSHDSEEPNMEIPSLIEATPPPPKFIENEIREPSSGHVSSPYPPVAATEIAADEAPAFGQQTESQPKTEEVFSSTTSPIPSPFDLPQPAKMEPVPDPPSSEASAPEQPAFTERETVIQPFPPASPFAEPGSQAPPTDPGFTPMPEPDFTPTPEPVFSPTPEPPPFKEPEPFQPAASSPLHPEASPAVWTPPPAPVAEWQDQGIGQNTPFQPPPAGGSVNQTLPIICLGLGIVSICCYISPVTGLAAVILGFMSLKNIKKDPANFGGKGLAIGGMIVGGIFFLIGSAYYIFLILVYAGILAGSLLQGF